MSRTRLPSRACSEWSTHDGAVRFLETVMHDDPGAFRHVIAWAMRR